MYAVAGMMMCLWMWENLGGGTSACVGSKSDTVLSKSTTSVRRVGSPVMIQVGSKATTIGTSALMSSHSHLVT